MTNDDVRTFNRRQATRYELQVPTYVEGADAVTENVSSLGVLLVGAIEPSVGSTIQLDMALPALLGGGQRFRFTAEVVRVEARPEGMAVAARYTGWQLLDLDQEK